MSHTRQVRAGESQVRMIGASRCSRVAIDELQAALQVPADRQEEFLRQQCGDDSELLEEV